MKRPEVIQELDRCANVCCPNQIHEGRFTLTHLGETQHRPVLVVLCAPCAAASVGVEAP